MKKFVLVSLSLASLALGMCLGTAHAQQNLGPLDLPQINKSTKITTGNTYQAILSAVTDGAPSSQLKSMFVQNNNSADNCYLDDTGAVAAGNTTSTSVTVGGVALTAQQASLVLAPGGSYSRTFPYLPSGAVVATCANSGDSLFVSIQQ